MARSLKRRLKVYQTRLGFYDTVVAAPNQAAALRAWGLRQNLFASGEAKLADDPAAAEAALDHPETPLRRPAGTDDPFRTEPDGAPRLPRAAKPKPAKAKVKSAAKTASKPRPPPPPDRSDLDAAEATLRELDASHRAEAEDLAREETALKARRAAAERAYVAARKTATAKVVAARSAFRKSGGKE